MYRLVIVLLGLSSMAVADEPDPLFQSDAILDITLRGPFVRIMRVRSDVDEEPGQLIYVDTDGETRTFDIKLRARGNYRRQEAICPFSPLRLNFAKSAVKDTLFDKQDKLKLVTHCMTKEKRYEQSVIREYLAYRLLNALTDKSFRVRLLRITYEETEARRLPAVEYGFVIEHKDRLARRTGLELVEGIGRVRTREVDPEHLAIGSVFHYLIGNTDFSPVSSTAEDDCCHNHALFRYPDGPYVAVPYDFDMSGFAYTEYARANPRFNLRSVKTRLYRGRCSHNDELDMTLALFREKREVLYGLVNDEATLEKLPRRAVLRFMDDFYKTINNPKRVQSRLVDRCLGSNQLPGQPVANNLGQSRMDVIAD